MKIVFFKISSMKYYKGHCDDDVPYNGGSFVAENGYGHEELNFLPIQLNDEEEIQCLGFVEPKSNRGKRNTFHLERINGCKSMKNEPLVEDVLVVWCATRTGNETTIVGWYKHATVFKNLQSWILEHEDGAEEREYNVISSVQNCTLLPVNERDRNIWRIQFPGQKFGQSMVWYPSLEDDEEYINAIVDAIENYNGGNWIDKYPQL